MCAMSEASSNVESNSPDSSAEAKGFLLRHSTAIATITTLYTAIFIIYLLAVSMWDEDEVRLHILNALIRTLQTIARIVGGWALLCEKAYNDYASTLH